MSKYLEMLLNLISPNATLWARDNPFVFLIVAIIGGSTILYLSYILEERMTKK